MSLTAGRDECRAASGRGQYVRARPYTSHSSIAADATLRMAVRRTGTCEIAAEHLMEKVRRSQGETACFLLVDASSSMRLGRKIRFAKQLAWILLERSYRSRSRVALIAVRGETPEVRCPLTADLTAVFHALEELPSGGKTPLTPAVLMAIGMAKRQRRASAAIILISDGKGNVFKGDSFEDDASAIEQEIGTVSLVAVNTESPARSPGVLEDLASRTGGRHYFLDEVV